MRDDHSVETSHSPCSMFGPKEIHCLQQCHATMSNDMTRCIVREEVRTPGVPYGDTFSCVSYTDVRRAPDNDNACLVSISAGVVFTKQPNYIASGKIVSEAHKDYCESATLWRRMAFDNCADNAAILSDFRAMTSVRLPIGSRADSRDATSLQDLSTRLHRALSRSGSSDSFGSSRRGSEILRPGHDRGRTSRHGSVDLVAEQSGTSHMPLPATQDDVRVSTVSQSQGRSQSAAHGSQSAASGTHHAGSGATAGGTGAAATFFGASSNSKL
jgi:hypothetical protein